MLGLYLQFHEIRTLINILYIEVSTFRMFVDLEDAFVINLKLPWVLSRYFTVRKYKVSARGLLRCRFVRVFPVPKRRWRRRIYVPAPRRTIRRAVRLEFGIWTDSRDA